MVTVPSIDNSNRLVDITAAVGQTAFAITWPVIADSEILAVADMAMLVNNVVINPATLSFSGNVIAGLSGMWNGGTLTRSSACVGGERVIIYSNRAPRRTGNFLEGKSLPWSELDKLQDDFAVQLRDIDLRLKRAPLVTVQNYIDGVDPNTVVTTVSAAAASAVAAAAVASGAAGTVGSGASLWQRPVISGATSPPGGPAIGDRYLVAHSGTSGAFVGKEDQVAEWNGAIWIYSGAPKVNQLIEIGNTTYRYSQEAQDATVAWRPVYIAAGGTRGVGEPVDQPCALNSISTDARPTCLGTSGFGTANPVLHFHKARGTQAAPTMPLNGDSIGSIGYRAYDTGTAQFCVSSAAISAYLTEDARSGSAYSASALSFETTSTGGGHLRREVMRVNSDANVIFYGTSGVGATNTFMPGAGSIRWFYGDLEDAGMAIQSRAQTAIFLNRNISDGAIMDFRKETVTVGTISVTGVATAYNTACDERLKTASDYKLDTGAIIDAARPQSFFWKLTGELDFGFFAQHLADVFCRPVTVGSPADVQPSDPDFKPWQVDNSKLVPVLWEETRRLRQRVRVLEISVCIIGVALLALALKVL